MEVNTATVQLDTSDGKMEAYEVTPRDGGPHPGIVVLMEAFGVNSHIKDVTERVAREGYVAIAPDLYHREPERLVPYKELQKAIGIMNRLQDPKTMDDGGAAISHLKSQSAVTQGAIGVMGFCMGGRFTYLTAAHHNKDIKAACNGPKGVTLDNNIPTTMADNAPPTNPSQVRLALMPGAMTRFPSRWLQTN